MLTAWRVQGIDFDRPDSNRRVPPAKFGTKFVTTHQDTCTAARFSRDGKYAATGSADTSIKLLDVAKLRSYNQNKSEVGDVGNFAGARPVIRTYYEHTASVTDLDFHPTKARLCSASKDMSIKFYDFQEPTKRSCGQITVRTSPSAGRQRR